jgi:hypothetical protein
MSCRKAFDIDLAAFLSEAGGEEFAQFREHYPVCPDCSAEVRAWTDLHALLQAGSAGTDGEHPEAEVLLRYEQGSPPLSAAETAQVENHLVRCNTCREELTALRRFDFSTLTTEAARPERARKRFAELLTPLRGLLLHPVFAYALVLVLLYPTVTAYLEGPGVPEPGLAVLSQSPAPQKRADAESAPLRQAAKDKAQLRRGMSPAPGPAEGKAVAELAKGRARMQAEPPSAAPAEEPPVAGTFMYRAAPVLDEDDTVEALAGEVQAARPATQSSADLPEERAIRAYEMEAVGEREGMRMERREAIAELQVYGTQAPHWLLRLPVPEEMRGATRFEVRIVHADGLREIRQRFVSAEAGDEVEIRLPVDWRHTDDDRVEFKTLP